MDVTRMNYFQFFHNPTRAYTGPDKELGYPALGPGIPGPRSFFRPRYRIV